MLNKCHKTTWYWNQKRQRKECLHSSGGTIACTAYIVLYFHVLSLHQGRRHLQYTSTACSDLIHRFEWTGFMVESGNMTASQFSKQRCFLICFWSLMWAAGSSPWHKLTAVEIANKPQSVPPFWCCMFTIHKIIFFSVDWRMADTCSFRLHVGDGKGLSYTSTTPGGQLMLLTHPQWELLRLIIWMKLSEREFHRNMKGTLSGGGHTASPTKQKGDMEWGATARPLHV